MHNCTFQNARQQDAQADRQSNRLFSEDKYAHYYHNLSSLADKDLTSAPEGKRERGTSLSGPGSNAEQTVGVRMVLPVLLSLLGARSMIDVPCGDFNYMRTVLHAASTPAGIEYTGLDIVAPLVEQLQTTFGSAQAKGATRPHAKGHAKGHAISFARFDLSLEYLWPADVVVVRDILFHFDLPRANAVLRRIGLSGCRVALITTFPRGSNSLSSRKYRIGHGFNSYASWNLEDAPFSLPPPLISVGEDGGRTDRIMGLWPCATLRATLE